MSDIVEASQSSAAPSETKSDDVPAQQNDAAPSSAPAVDATSTSAPDNAVAAPDADATRVEASDDAHSKPEVSSVPSESRLDDSQASAKQGKSESGFQSVDRDSVRAASSVGGFSSSIHSHSFTTKHRLDSVLTTGHISTESRQVMRKGYDLGISSPGVRAMYDVRIKELEEDLEIERFTRNKADKQRAELQREITSLADRLEEANEAARMQVEATRRRDAEFLKLHRDLEESQAQNEAQLAAFRKKHQESVNQLTEQLDQLHKSKQKMEKEKTQQKVELDELRGHFEHAVKAKSASEKLCKQAEVQLSEASNKIAELQKDLGDTSTLKNRFQQDNFDLSRRLDDAANQLDQANKAKQVLAKQLEDVKLAVDDETTVRNKVLGENRNLQALVEQLRDQLEEEQERRGELQRQLTKANNETSVWRQRFESGEGGIRPEEVDDLKKKFGARIQDGEAQLEAALAKAIGFEKAKNRSQMEIEALLAEVEKCQSVNTQNEKRQRQTDRLVDELKRKVNDVQNALDNAQKESRANAAETYKFKSQLEEANEAIEVLRRENKNLSEEIHELTDQINQSNIQLQEAQKHGKRFEQERDELQATLEEAEAALEQEEARADRAQADVAAIKDEMEKRFVEKDEELESARKAHQRALDAMQINLEAEARSKADALRIKKKLEQDICDLETAIDGFNKAKIESEKSVKKYQQQIRDLHQQVEEEQRTRQSYRDEITASERRNGLLAGEIEELKAQIETADKTRKIVESELLEAADLISELMASNAAQVAAKKKSDADFQALHTDYEERVNELKLAEEQSKKAMADASRLAEELRQEQEHAGQVDKLRRGLETQLKEQQVRVDEAEAAALHGGRKAIQKLEQRVRELEQELNAEQHRNAEAQKSLRKQDRRLQEVSLQLDEDHKAQDKMKDMIDKLQQKIKSSKKQVDDAEEIASINLARYRKMQHDLEEAEARAEMAENLLGQARSKSRLTSLISETSTQAYPGFTVKSTIRTQNISSETKHEAA